ncbi:MAG TPA: efflux transporter outer membrane subunit [Opitutales bacterium]|jgi:multidrug efflux system outer membrane protein|nr:efflux transporter outer membrane subunit [Opitutales bacterium]
MKTSTNFFLALTALALGGCAVGPDYHAPAINAAAQWSEPLAGGEVASPQADAAWWKNFHDSELDSLINRAVAANLDLKIAEARLREARAALGVADADFGPSLDASASATREKESEHQPVLGSLSIPPSVPFTNNVYQVGFDASWEIDVFGGARRESEAANADLAAAEYNRRGALLSLLGEVARNYVETRSYQRRLVIVRENIAAQSDALTLSKDRAAKGLTSDLDSTQATALLATTQAEVPTLESELEASIHRLGVLLAQPPGALRDELAQDAPIPASPAEVPVGLPSELLLRRPDVRQAERELAAQTARIGVATADLFPKFFLTGTAGWESINTGDLFSSGSKIWSIAPSVQWQIFDSGRIRANIHVQDARQEEALARYEQTVLIAFEEVENALVSYANEQVRHQSLAQAVAANQDALHLANQRYTNGLASFLDVVDAERALYETQDQLVQSDRTVAVDLIALNKALGGGWEVAPTPADAKVARN